jgi:hypothetical protein
VRLEKIVTLANEKVRLRFLAMERSLRAVGCDLPIWVIPYDGNLFDLPKGAEWWEMPEITEWLRGWKAHPTMRKYQCLTTSRYQFVDADLVFLRDPAKVLEEVEGFVTSCGHWHNPMETVTPESMAFLQKRSTTWQKGIFNTGQWACDRQLFTLSELKERAEESSFRTSCLLFPFHEQPGVNMLVNSTDVPISNLTLQPYNMQSTWAGAYDGPYQCYWRTERETPYLIHWAGVPMEKPRDIHELFYKFLTPTERLEWDEQSKVSAKIKRKGERSLRSRLRGVRRASKSFWKELSG